MIGLACASPESQAAERRLEQAKQREQAARAAEQAGLAIRAQDEAAAKAALEFERERLRAMQDEVDELAGELVAGDRDDGAPLRCPSGEWCGMKAIAERYSGEPSSDHPDALGCPGTLLDRPRSEGSRMELANLPPASMAYATLDPEATEAKRDQGWSESCCYAWGSLCDRPTQ